jgi:NAD-dependent SIR2 family protein deacetylase
MILYIPPEHGELIMSHASNKCNKCGKVFPKEQLLNYREFCGGKHQPYCPHCEIEHNGPERYLAKLNKIYINAFDKQRVNNFRKYI